MTNTTQLKTGADPRALPDYAALRDELAKLSHPARPDVDWRLVEQLSLSLFRLNGVELQTTTWYTLARTRLAGMTGLCEGLAIMEALLTHQWGTMWPQPVHARMEILAGFSQRLQSLLRTLTLRYADLPYVYQAERHLCALRDVLQRLELKQVSQMGELCTFMHNAVSRLESLDSGQHEARDIIQPASSSGLVTSVPARQVESLVYVVRDDPPAQKVTVMPPVLAPHRTWRGFTAGMATMLAVGCVGVWGWQKIAPLPDSPLPAVANEAGLRALEQFSPLWRQEYGFMLSARAGADEAEKLNIQWQQYIEGNALPPDALSGWHQGMEGLQVLARQLNALDERKGKYLTGSELKSMVFTITQNFSRAVPVEEQLYQLSLLPRGTPLPAAPLLQTDMHLNQLLNRYTLIKQSATVP